MDMRYGGGGGGCVSRYGGVGGGGGGGCIARYGDGGGGGCGLYDISMVDRMMLKFRPIAPKPVASGSGSGDSSTENGGKSGGRKRRYVRVKGKKVNKDDTKKRKVAASTSPEIVSRGGDEVLTLSLMPETPDRKENSPVKTSSPIWLSFKNNYQTSSVGDNMMMGKTVSFVTVELVTEMRVDGGLVEWAEMERDTCPRFISVGGDKVVWMNKAYREMVGSGGEEVVVVLVKNEGIKLPAAFTCNVKVTCRSSMKSSTLTVPCDTWRMASGGYAWRLDVKAALCLGR